MVQEDAQSLLPKPPRLYSSLQELDLSKSRLAGDLADLARQHPRLTRLNLSQCSEVTGEIGDIVKLELLEYLQVADCQSIEGNVTPAVVEQLSAMRARNGSDAVNMARCGKMTLTGEFSALSVTDIDLGGITSLEGPLALFAGVELRRLSIWNTMLRGTLNEVPSGSLEWLDVSFTKNIKGELPVW